MNTLPVEDGQQATFGSTSFAGREEQQQAGELAGVAIARVEHDRSLEQQPHSYSGVVEFISDLWNSVPPFIAARDRTRYTEERRRFVEENNNTYNQLGLREEYNQVLNAYDAVIALPAFGYHRNASQAYNTLRVAQDNAQVARDNAQNALLAARHRDPLITEGSEEVSLFHDTTPNTPGAHHVRRVNERTAADDVAQADDALRGQSGRALNDPVAAPISVENESDTVALAREEAPDDDTVTPVEIALHPAEMILEGIPRAEASYVAPTKSGVSASSRIDK